MTKTTAKPFAKFAANPSHGLPALPAPSPRIAYERELTASVAFHHPDHIGIIAEDTRSIKVLGRFSCGAVNKPRPGRESWAGSDQRGLGDYARDVFGAGGRLRKMAECDGVVYYAVFRGAK